LLQSTIDSSLGLSRLKIGEKTKGRPIEDDDKLGRLQASLKRVWKATRSCMERQEPCNNTTMRVLIQVDLPLDGAWIVEGPDDPELFAHSGKVPEVKNGENGLLRDWLWKYGKDQLLSKLSVALIDADATSTSASDSEEEKKDFGYYEKEETMLITTPTKSTDTEPTEATEATGMEHLSLERKKRLELYESLQTVKKDFMERIQDYESNISRLEDDEKVATEPEAQADDAADKDNQQSNRQNKAKSQFQKNPANIAMRELVDSVLSWSGTDYGFLADVQEAVNTTEPKTEAMNDVSDLDQSDGVQDKNLIMTIGPRIYASVNVPIYDEDEDENGFYDDDDDDGDDSDSFGSLDSTSSADQGRQNLLNRTPQPITTYGPVHYKDIPGSVTLMMDQLRFEPVNPLHKLHEEDDEDYSDHHATDSRSASLEYNYMQVYWDRVEKYQLTPLVSDLNLFKLIVRKPSSKSPKATCEVILRMKSRAELERIADDVKIRVVLPSKRNSKQKQSQQQRHGKDKKKRGKRRKKEDNGHNTDNKTAPAITRMTPQQRSAMLPPSLPVRMTSDRNLLKQPYRQENPRQQHFVVAETPTTSSPSSGSPAPLKSSSAAHSLSVNNFVYDDSDDDVSDVLTPDDAAQMDLWAVQDVLIKCRELKRPLSFNARKRDRRPVSPLKGTISNRDKDNNDKAEPSSVPLLPAKWDKLLVVPIFDSKLEKILFIFVLASTCKRGDDNTRCLPKFTCKDCLDWWVPSVKVLLQDIQQHKARLEQLAATNKTVEELREKLRDSLRRHSEMIHGILPPMAISKLKVQPHQWKSPMQQLYRPKPSVVPAWAGISVDESSISGSVHSRYGLLVGGAPFLDSNSTIQTSLYGAGTVGNSTVESEYGLYSVSENDEAKGGSKPKNLPERSASTRTAQQQAAIQQHSSNAPSSLQRTNSVGNINAAIRGLHRQGSVTNRTGTTLPIFSRVGSKRDMMMMRASSARGVVLMRMDSAKRGNLMKMDSGRFGRRAIPRLDSLRSLHGSLHGSLSVNTSGGLSVESFDQSWRTMYVDDESMQFEDLSNHSGTAQLSVLSQDVSYLTSECNKVKYINSALIGGIKDVQALYAGTKSHVSIIVVSVVDFHQLTLQVRVATVMDILAKLLYTVDRLCEKYRTIKVETIGHKIIVMSGLFVGDSDEERGEDADRRRDRQAALDALDMAQEMVSEAQTIEIPRDSESDGKTKSTGKSNNWGTLKLRVGIHVGKVKYGVLGQNVPKLNCFGDDIFVALRMEQTAPENCIRVSKIFHDIVGDAEVDWERDTEWIEIFCGMPTFVGAEVATLATIVSASPSVEATGGVVEIARSIESYTLEPPPPAIDGISGSSITSFPSLSPWTGADFKNLDVGGLLGVQLEESFVSGEFYVD
jgi:class 3 adenylate cyclase